ncbi:hypothetical protein BFJ69_g16717 [Fusarium oxysporum]|uniref:Uncharacterized protein n=1 Tax=Fusarium oxysporum TaxID=5507 RepID=A0A420MAC1_FUSOX|nr:hypothetical protein BFJ66_g17128 [Fusarium oxysporum f. sp. cepae]RKK64413.1 hypothetical protein BFJ69_g16717 [Fusarium oxysporum]
MGEAPETCDSGVWAKLRADIIRTPRRVPMGPLLLFAVRCDPAAVAEPTLASQTKGITVLSSISVTILMSFLPTIVSSYPMYLSALDVTPLAMTGLVALSGHQPPSPILAPGQDTSKPLETAIEPDDTQAMSPRMTSEEVEALKCEMHTGLHRHAKALQDSLLLIFNRIEAAEKGNEKLDSNKKVLQKYIEDLTSMHQTTALDRHEKY